MTWLHAAGLAVTGEISGGQAVSGHPHGEQPSTEDRGQQGS